MMPMNPLQMQLIQQQMMGGGMGGFNGFNDDIYDMIDPQLLDGLYLGYGLGHEHGVDQASQYYYYLLQQLQMAQQMQMMPYYGRGFRNPRRRVRKMLQGGMGMGMGMNFNAGIGGYGGRAVMGSPFGVGGGVRGNQLMIGASPWGGHMV